MSILTTKNLILKRCKSTKHLQTLKTSPQQEVPILKYSLNQSQAINMSKPNALIKYSKTIR